MFFSNMTGYYYQDESLTAMAELDSLNRVAMRWAERSRPILNQMIFAADAISQVATKLASRNSARPDPRRMVRAVISVLRV
jgi:hypothetical protein